MGVEPTLDQEFAPGRATVLKTAYGLLLSALASSRRLGDKSGVKVKRLASSAPGPHWDEEKVAEFSRDARAKPGCAATSATMTQVAARCAAPVKRTVDSAARHAAGYAF